MERDIGINGKIIAEFELTDACKKVAQAATPASKDFPKEVRARWGIAVLELARLIGVTLNSKPTREQWALIFDLPPACANCDGIGTTKALIRNDAGDICGVIYSCGGMTCKNKVRSGFTQGDQMTLRPDQRGEG